MSRTVNEESIILEPCEVFWGSQGISTIETVANTTDALDGLFFDIDARNEVGEVLQYRFWLSSDAAVAPSAAGKILVEIELLTDDTAETVATKIKAAMEAVTALDEVITIAIADDLLTVSGVYFGILLIGAGTSTFTVDIDNAGEGGTLGSTQGGVEVSFETGAVDVTSDQTGEQVLDAIMNANNISVSMTLQELTLAKWQLLVGGVTGETFTPMGGTAIVGIGESKRFKNMKQYSKWLYLKPVGAVSNSRNHNFWKSAPALESVNFSGSDIQNAPLSFRCFRDLTKDIRCNIWAFGDGTQDLGV